MWTKRTPARTAWFVIAALLSSLVVSAVNTPPAHAALPCTSAPKMSYFAGNTTAFSTSIWGASARIEYNNPNLCGDDGTNSDGLSMAWSMVHAHSANGHNYEAWAQSGYGQGGPANNYWPHQIWQFSQYRRQCAVVSNSCGGASTLITKFIYTNPDPKNPWIYTSRWRTDIDNRIYMYANGVMIDKTDYNPAGVWSSKWQGQYFGETKELSSDIVGTAADVTAMDHVRWVDSSQVFHFANLTGSSTDSYRYHATTFSPSSGGTGIHIWTDPIH